MCPDEFLGGLNTLSLTMINSLWHDTEVILSYGHIQELDNGDVCIIHEQCATVVKAKKNRLIC